MKRIIVLSLVILASSCLSSCGSINDFYREQNELDAESKGRAILKQAESEKKALIEEARAKNEAATMEAEARIKIAKAQAQAEIERAKGAAEANRIIGTSLKGNSEYLKYLYIEVLREGEGDRVYIATEAGLPILEAGK